uniref:Uncharacterized protein n=1 Tax=Arundo donax TaxID=35708 RepID=A0A0A9GKK2_ARUDO
MSAQRCQIHLFPQPWGYKNLFFSWIVVVAKKNITRQTRNELLSPGGSRSAPVPAGGRLC